MIPLKGGSRHCPDLMISMSSRLYILIGAHCWGALKKCRVADAVKIIKTWSNGWATSSRYHEGVLLPCVFGCNCIDKLEHYFQCPYFFALWTFLVGNVSSDPLERWGLIRPEPDAFLQIVCVFCGYHAIRRKFQRKSELFVNNQNTLTGPQLRVAWTVFADAFCAEAREVKFIAAVASQSPVL